MIEKVNPAHPDKIADRIAGAIVDLAYIKEDNPKMAVEVLIGHNKCTIITEGTKIEYDEVRKIVDRIVGKEVELFLTSVSQDDHLAKNQDEKIRCGDNGIFKGIPVTNEQLEMIRIAKAIYSKYPTDGKYVLDYENRRLIVCQSQCDSKQLYDELKRDIGDRLEIVVNPLGDWTGGINTDTGATNRKLGSDMGDSVTGGGLCGKDLSKADVSINIYSWLKAQELGKEYKLSCAIGDEYVDGKPYSEIVKIAKDYINSLGGFEKFAEWGLYR